MYSLVLMSAMSTAPATPEFNGYFRDLFFGCNGCNGCYGGGARYGCGGCGGCDGFLGFGLMSRRPLFDRGSCYGCGGCYGYSQSPGYGCGAASYAPSYGGCHGSSSYSCYGGPAVSYGGGCYGYSSVVPGAAGTAIPTIPYAPVDPAPASTSNLTPASYTAAALPPGARATVVVKLPVDAKLYAEGRLLALTSAERKFVTPPLPEGEFAYRFKVEYDRDGETYSVTKRVPVKAGGTVTVEFTEQAASKGGMKANVTTTAEPPAAPSVVPAAVPPVAPTEKTDRATITVKLPPGATLYVDDKKNSSGEPVRQFTTPPIPVGKEYAYNMKAEVIRDGRPETITQKVSFKAGDKLVVDLTAGK